MNSIWIDILKLVIWLACGFITARVLYLKVYSVHENEGEDQGDKVLALATFFFWPLAVAITVLLLTLYGIVQAVTWQRSKKV